MNASTSINALDRETGQNPSTVKADTVTTEYSGEAIAKGGVACPFPWRVHDMLEAVEREGLSHVVCWQPHGRAFTVVSPKDFVDLILPR